MKAADFSSKPLLIVQEVDLNRHLDSPLEIAWEKKRTLVEIVLPLLAFVFVGSMEIIIARTWADGEHLCDHLPKILGVPTALAGLVFLGMEWEFRTLGRMKRKMKLHKKGLVLNCTKFGRVMWEHLSSWMVEPITSEPGLQKLTLQYARDKKGRLKHSWSMVLKQPEQTDALNAYIERLRETGVNIPTIINQTVPTPKKVTKMRSILDVCITVVACLLSINGFYLLVGGIGLSNDRPGTPSHTNAAPTEFQAMISRHFSSVQELRQFLLFTGGGLILVGGFLLIYEMCSRRKTSVTETKEEPIVS